MTPVEALDDIESMLDAANMSSTVKVDVFVGEPTPRYDGDGGAHPYLAIFPGAGPRDLIEKDIAGTPGEIQFRFQITAAGGDVARAMRAITRAQSVLVGKRLDSTTGLIREDGDGGPVRKDDTVHPARWFTPLLMVVDL